MAKLNVAYPNIEIEVGGQKYRKVYREAQAGDIVKITDISVPDYIEDGGFYEVVRIDSYGDPQIFDEDGDEYDLCNDDYEVYEKVTEPEQPERLKVGEYAKVVQRGHHRFGKIVKVTQNDRISELGFIYNTQTIDGKSADVHALDQLTRATEDEVAAAKKAAERAKAIGPFADGGYAVVKTDADGYLSGGYRGSYVMVRPTDVSGPFALELELADGSRPGFCNADALRKVTKEEYEEATNPKPNVSVGDKVRITRYQCNWPEGTVVTITEPDVGGVGKTARAMSEDGRIFLTDYDSFELLSAEELAQIAEEAKWAKIGRKVNEFKAGDIVQITANTNGSVNKVGSYGEVTGGPSISGSYRVETGAGSVSNLTRPDDMRLIVHVEQRLDMQKEAA